MGRFIVRRLLTAVPTLVAVSFIIYAILAVSPIDPLSQFGADPRIPPEVRESVRRSLGLDQSWPVRYLKWLVALLHGDFGYSFMSRTPVADLILQRLPNTLAVVGVAYAVGVILAIPIGVLSAVKHHSIWDNIAMTLTFVGFSVPTFFTGLLCILVFSVTLRWLPSIYDSTLQVTDFVSLGAQIRQSILPILVLSFVNIAILTRYVRAEMLEHFPLDYVRTARSKGLRESRVIMGHVLRNSLMPVVTLIALGVPAVFGGAIVTEQIFRVPGIGELLVRSIGDGDIPVVVSIVLIFAVLVVIFNLVADVLYAVLDPRIKYP